MSFATSRMADGVDWAKILDLRYKSFKVEVDAFLNSCDVSSSTEIAQEMIYEAIKCDQHVSENLKLLYKEACYGTNKDVKLRIKNRITNFRRALR